MGCFLGWLLQIVGYNPIFMYDVAVVHLHIQCFKCIKAQCPQSNFEQIRFSISEVTFRTSWGLLELSTSSILLSFHLILPPRSLSDKQWISNFHFRMFFSLGTQHATSHKSLDWSRPCLLDPKTELYIVHTLNPFVSLQCTEALQCPRTTSSAY